MKPVIKPTGHAALPANTSSCLSHAVVLGGSFAGLLAASVLSRYAARVTVIERDEAPSLATRVRKGAPQGNHAHLLLRSGLDSLRALFPGIDADLEAVAGPAFDVVRDTRWKVDGLFRPRFDSDYRSYALGRPALEQVVRTRVSTLSNVEFAYGRTVSGFFVADVELRGVRLADGQELRADLIIDASGRGTRVPHWLSEAGFEPPPVMSAELGLRYASCVVEPGPTWRGDYRMLLVPPVHPRCPRGGLLVPLENGRFVVTLISYGGEPPPRDFEGVRAWAERIDDPSLAAVLRDANPLSEPSSFAIPQQIWRRYDRAQRLPSRLVVVGDALSSFDPAFGQGMSVAALEAVALEALLRAGWLPDNGLAARFFARTEKLIATPWSMGRARPAASDATTAVSRAQRWMRAYRKAFMEAAADSEVLHRAFLRVVNLQASPASLLAPALALRTLMHHMSHGQRRLRTDVSKQEIMPSA